LENIKYMGKKGKSGRKPGKYYILNDDIVKEVRKYYDTGVFSYELGQIINKTVDGVAHMPKVINYFKEDNPWGIEMRSDAVFRISKAIVEKGCRVIPEEEIGKVINDDDGNVVYKKDKDGNIMCDENGDKIIATVEQNNLFGYFTVIAFRAFIARIKLEKKQQELMDNYKYKVFEDFENEYGVIHQENNQDVDYQDYNTKD